MPPPDRPYVSSIPYEPQRIHAAAVYCSDGRLTEHIDDFLHNVLRLPRYDRVACPGGPVCLAGRLAAYWETSAVEEQIRFLARVHEIRRAVLIAHSDCAYYARRLSIPSDQMETEQSEDLQKAASTMRRLVSGIDVALYFARIRGNRVVFETV